MSVFRIRALVFGICFRQITGYLTAPPKAHKLADDTKHDVYYPSSIGPLNQNVRSFVYVVSWAPVSVCWAQGWSLQGRLRAGIE